MITGAAGLALVMAFLSSGAAAQVPFVGCPADGQQGPAAAPARGATPDLPAAAAARLAFYRAEGGLGVLAPRGWHCFGMSGSNGALLVVAPGRLDAAVVTRGRLAGPAVQLSFSNGSTSGRFEVAAVAARLFPAAKPFVDRVEAERLNDRIFARSPDPTDRITHHGPYRALFTTPAGREGLGTMSKLVPGTLPIDGAVSLDRGAENDMTMLVARLLPADRALVAYIIADASRRR